MKNLMQACGRSCYIDAFGVAPKEKPTLEEAERYIKYYESAGYEVKKEGNKTTIIYNWGRDHQNPQGLIMSDGYCMCPLVEDGPSDLSGSFCNCSAGYVKEMEETKIVKYEDSYIFPNFPIFNEKNISIILSKVDSICSKIIKDIYIPFLPRIQETWIEIKPANWEIQNIEKFFIREVYDRSYNLTLDILIEEGIILPSPVDPPCDYWGINGYFNVL